MGKAGRRVLSRSWFCQASGADLTDAEDAVLVEYRLYCNSPHSGVPRYPSRRHYMAFCFDAELLWLHFGKYWDGELKVWGGAGELDKAEKARLAAFHDCAKAAK